jgi:hypothetical protein
MTIGKREERVIRNVIKRLRGDKASSIVEMALKGRELSLYLDSWVIPALELIIKDERTLDDLKLADELSS